MGQSARSASFVMSEDEAMQEFLKSLTYAIGLVDAQAAANQAPRNYALIRRHADCSPVGPRASAGEAVVMGQSVCRVEVSLS